MDSTSKDLASKARVDSGIRNLPWDEPAAGENLLRIDFASLLAAPDAEVLIRSLPPQLVYHSLKMAETELLTQIVPLLSDDQFTRILDYDTWPAQQLSKVGVLEWLRLHQEKQGPMGMAKRFRALEEEYQLATLDQCIHVYEPEEYETLSEDVKDRVVALPGGQYFYEIIAEDVQHGEMIMELIDSAIALDMGYAFNLLAHAAFIPPNESELQLIQFRTARMEEDGFVGFDEAMRTFVPLQPESVKAQYHDAQEPALSRTVDVGQNFLEIAVSEAVSNGRWTNEDGYRFQQGSLFVANAMVAAFHLDPTDLDASNRFLEQAKASMSLALDYLADSNQSKAVDILKVEMPKTLLRVGLGLAAQMQERVVISLRQRWNVHASVIERIQHFRAKQKFAELADVIDNQLLDVCGLQVCEALKGIFNRFPMRLVADNSGLSFRFATVANLAALAACESGLHLVADKSSRSVYQ